MYTVLISFLEGEEAEVERTDDKIKASTNEDIRLRLGSIEQSHGQNHQYRLNNISSHKTYKGKIHSFPVYFYNIIKYKMPPSLFLHIVERFIRWELSVWLEIDGF